MKMTILLSALLMSFSVLADVNCDIYLVMSEVDGRSDISEKILSQFESQGYKFTRVEKPSDISDQGKVSYMSIFSDLNSATGATTSIKLVDLYVRDDSVTSRSESSISLTRKPMWGSAEKSLLKSVKKIIPVCEKND